LSHGGVSCNLCNFVASNGTDTLLGARELRLQNLNPTAILSRFLLRRAVAIAGELSLQREKTRALLFVFGFCRVFNSVFTLSAKSGVFSPGTVDVGIINCLFMPLTFI